MEFLAYRIARWTSIFHLCYWFFSLILVATRRLLAQPWVVCALKPLYSETLHLFCVDALKPWLHKPQRLFIVFYTILHIYTYTPFHIHLCTYLPYKYSFHFIWKYHISLPFPPQTFQLKISSKVVPHVIGVMPISHMYTHAHIHTFIYVF